MGQEYPFDELIYSLVSNVLNLIDTSYNIRALVPSEGFGPSGCHGSLIGMR